ncbi:MAG: 23S rRNA (cytosine1962-C5)-methyltransferase, partial [Myxococcota bacterium]
MGEGYRRGNKKQRPRSHQGRATTPQAPPRRGVVVNGYSEKWLSRGFPWVYTEEIVARSQSPDLSPGEVVTIFDAQHTVLGVGIFDTGKIGVRRMREDDGPLDVDLLRDKLKAAAARRALPPETNAWRLVHGESDDLPGVRIEVFGELAVITLDAPSLQPLLEPLLVALRETVSLTSIWLHWRPSDED